MKFVYVFIGGGLGSVCRYLLSLKIYSWYGRLFPLGTLSVNIIGCFMIGFLFSIFEIIEVHPNIRIFLLIGFLGGFTTFSSFGLETWNLLRQSDYRSSIMYILFSNVFGLTAVGCGFFSGRLFR